MTQCSCVMRAQSSRSRFVVCVCLKWLQYWNYDTFIAELCKIWVRENLKGQIGCVAENIFLQGERRKKSVAVIEQKRICVHYLSSMYSKRSLWSQITFLYLAFSPYRCVNWEALKRQLNNAYLELPIMQSNSTGSWNKNHGSMWA